MYILYYYGYNTSFVFSLFRHLSWSVPLHKRIPTQYHEILSRCLRKWERSFPRRIRWRGTYTRTESLKKIVYLISSSLLHTESPTYYFGDTEGGGQKSNRRDPFNRQYNTPMSSSNISPSTAFLTSGGRLSVHFLGRSFI